MMRLKRAQVQPIGLDVGHDSVKMLQLEVSGETLSVVAASKRELPAEAKGDPKLALPAAMDLVRQMMRHGGFVGRGVVAAVPRQAVHVKNLRLPVMPADELEPAIKFEAKGLFPFDVDQAAVRFLQAGEVRQGNEVRQEVVVLAAPDEEINNFLEQLHRAGLVVESLDAEPCALFRGVERFVRRREDEQEVHLLVDVGARRTQVVIGKGRDISFFKPIDVGGRNLAEAVSKKLGITLEEAYALRRRLADAPVEKAEAPAEGAAAADAAPAGDRGKRDPVRQAVFDATRSTLEELTREISLCLRYHSVTFRGQRPAKMRLLGGEGADPQLHALLKAALTIPLEVGRPLQHVDVSAMNGQDRRGAMGEWAVALGLGLKMTRERFSAAAGSLLHAAGAASGAQVVDLAAAVDAAMKEGAKEPAKQVAKDGGRGRGAAAEATHA